MPPQMGRYSGNGRNSTARQSYSTEIQRDSYRPPRPSHHDPRVQRTDPHSSHPNSGRQPRLTSPEHHHHQYSSDTPYSTNTTNATRRICSCDQRHEFTIDSVFREVDILEQHLTSVLRMMRDLRPNENKMDWQYEDTVLIDNGKMCVIKGGVNEGRE